MMLFSEALQHFYGLSLQYANIYLALYSILSLSILGDQFKKVGTLELHYFTAYLLQKK